MSLNISSGIEHNFALEKFKNYDGALWSKLKKYLQHFRSQNYLNQYMVYDLFGKALAGAYTNLSISSLAEVVELKKGNILDIPAPISTGILITNPPCGKRLGE